MKLSVIVPVYNVEKYLKKCLDSLVVQTLSDIEIIIVNDGSPDQSQVLIDEYVEKYDFVKGYSKENGGLSDARNFGIEKASGEYIAFVDSDDYIEPSMYEIMYQKAIEENYDVVVCGFEEIYPDHIYIGTTKVKHDLTNREEVKEQMIDIYPSAWNKIYRKELFRDIRFKKGVWFEDVEILYRLFPFIKSIGVVEEPLYKYVQREGSISKSNDKRIFHHIENWNGILEFYKLKGVYKEYSKELEYCYVRYLYATFIKAALKFDKKQYIEAVEIAITNVKHSFPNYRKNRYFYKNLKGIYLLLFNRSIALVYYMLKG